MIATLSTASKQNRIVGKEMKERRDCNKKGLVVLVGAPMLQGHHATGERNWVQRIAKRVLRTSRNFSNYFFPVFVAEMWPAIFVKIQKSFFEDFANSRSCARDFSSPLCHHDQRGLNYQQPWKTTPQ
jgi:hypothetical protein